MSYARRQIEQEIRRAEQTRRRREDKLTHADAVIRRYEEAYAAIHEQKAPRIEYSGGWYVIHQSLWGIKRVREAKLAHMTRVLWALHDAREEQGDD